MSTTSHPYEPSQRLIDDRQELARLYVEQDLSIREIADNHAKVSTTPIYNALVDFGILDDNEESEQNMNRGFDPPSEADESGVEWSKLM